MPAICTTLERSTSCSIWRGNALNTYQNTLRRRMPYKYTNSLSSMARMNWKETQSKRSLQGEPDGQGGSRFQGRPFRRGEPLEDSSLQQYGSSHAAVSALATTGRPIRGARLPMLAWSVSSGEPYDINLQAYESRVGIRISRILGAVPSLEHDCLIVPYLYRCRRDRRCKSKCGRMSAFSSPMIIWFCGS
ncbi:unnamed protein product [Nesidiocoris tenuis]|uniref:Uncharacterized protein n=1 Tax=Nesidiocoris tenuis TaxID=355587 RepID=A0A6H5GRE8_9HEMI|nr:unnamed protein product [Nesidiocoris tenuis]